jgi:SAM-dependent methyltransferase
MERAEYDLMASLEGSMWWYRALHVRLLSLIERAGLPSGARVLDAGCGTGGFLERLSAARPDLSLTGIEIDEPAAATARRKTGLDITVGSVNRMPYPSGSFSAVVSADVLYHRNVDERAALAEFHRCLTGRGLLLMNLPAYEWLASAHDHRVHGARRYRAARAADLVRAAGFCDIRVRHWNVLLFPIMAAHRLVTARATAASDVRSYPGWQNELLFAVMMAEHRLLSLGLRIPFGGSIQIEARK